MYVTGVGHTSLSSASIRSGEIIIPIKMWHQRGTLTYPRFRTRCTQRTRHGRSRLTGTPQRWAFDDLSPLHMQALRQGWVSRPVSKGMHAGHKSEMGAVTGFGLCFTSLGRSLGSFGCRTRRRRRRAFAGQAEFDINGGTSR
jgi:hypothetical protein